MDAGASLFAERGYDGVTLAQIARRSRANKAMMKSVFRMSLKFILNFPGR